MSNESGGKRVSVRYARVGGKKSGKETRMTGKVDFSYDLNTEMKRTLALVLAGGAVAVL